MELTHGSETSANYILLLHVCKCSGSEAALEYHTFCILTHLQKYLKRFLCIRIKSVKRTVVIPDAYFLRIKPTDCPFLTNNINVVLFSNIYFPNCFGIYTPSSGRFNHKGKQKFININIIFKYLYICVILY
jgi:hypothetical protein